jgi:hypothetical protein
MPRRIVLLLDVPILTTSRLRDPSSQRWNYIHKPLFLDFPAFTTSRLLEILAAKSGTSFGSRVENFFALKNGTASAGFKPAILGTKSQHATLVHRSRFPYKNKLV